MMDEQRLKTIFDQERENYRYRDKLTIEHVQKLENTIEQLMKDKAVLQDQLDKHIDKEMEKRWLIGWLVRLSITLRRLMFGPGRSDGGIVQQASGIRNHGSKVIRNGGKQMPRKSKKEIDNKEYVNNKKFWVQIDFDDCVSIHEELQAKQMFLGDRNKLVPAEKRLLEFTEDVMFGNYQEVTWQ